MDSDEVLTSRPPWAARGQGAQMLQRSGLLYMLGCGSCRYRLFRVKPLPYTTTPMCKHLLPINRTAVDLKEYPKDSQHFVVSPIWRRGEVPGTFPCPMAPALRRTRARGPRVHPTARIAVEPCSMLQVTRAPTWAWGKIEPLGDRWFSAYLHLPGTGAKQWS